MIVESEGTVESEVIVKFLPNLIFNSLLLMESKVFFVVKFSTEGPSSRNSTDLTSDVIFMVTTRSPVMKISVD